MKIGFVFHKDSHLKAVEMTALRVMRQYVDAQFCFFGLLVDNNLKPDIKVTYQIVCDNNFFIMKNYDYLICCLGGRLLNQLISHYSDSSTKVVSLFPGVVSHYQLDAFITRFRADQVWLNCAADMKFYAHLCHIFNVRNNSILYGAPWIDTNQSDDHVFDNLIIFFEQTQVILNANMASKVLMQLINIIKSKPDCHFIYKTRDNIYNEYLVDIRKQIQALPNVTITNKLNKQDIARAGEYLSISSSAIIEGLVHHKRCFLLSKDYLDGDSREIFSDSGLFLDQSQQSLSQKWLNERVSLPNKHIDLLSIYKQKLPDLSKKNIEVIFYFFNLCLICPKLFKLFFNIKKIKLIKRSLEYVSNA